MTTRWEEADVLRGRSGAVMGGSAQAKVIRGGAMMPSCGPGNSGRLGGGMEMEVYADPEAAIKEAGRHAGGRLRNPGHGQFTSSHMFARRGDNDNVAGGSSEYSAGRDALWREGALGKAERDNQGTYLRAAGGDDLESTDAGGFERGVRRWGEGEGDGREWRRDGKMEEIEREEEEEEEEEDQVARETRAFLAEMMTRFVHKCTLAFTIMAAQATPRLETHFEGRQCFRRERCTNKP